MDIEALLVVGGFVLAFGAVLLALAFLVSRFLQPRSRSSNHIRVTGLGFGFGIVQTIATFVVVGWGFFRPETFLGQVVAHAGGVPAIIAFVGILCYFICVALQRSGVLLYYRSQGGG